MNFAEHFFLYVVLPFFGGAALGYFVVGPAIWAFASWLMRRKAAKDLRNSASK